MAEKETPEIVDTDNLPMDEETASAATLHPQAGSGGGDTKVEMLATFTQLLSQLGKEDLSSIFNAVQSQYGPGKAPGAEDKSAANKASINAKPSAAVGKGGASAPDAMVKLAVKEDLDEMFASDEDLTEEMKEKTAVIFEAALNTRVNLEVARLEEEFEGRAAELEEAYAVELEEQTAAILEDVTEKLDQYLDYCVEQWMEENKLAIESSLRAEIAEDFIQSLHNVFAEHYIRVPDEQIDLVAEMKAENEALKAKLNETIDEKLELESVVVEATKAATLEEVSEGLAETQIEKLRTLAEGIEYSDADNYKKKLEIVKENYFSGKKAGTSTGLITEEIDGTDDSIEEKTVPAHMQNYVQAISKSVK